MGSFLSLAQEKIVLFGLRDYGVDDLSTGWVIGEIIKNSDIFNDFYERYPLQEVTTMESYCLYLFSLRLAKLRDAIPRIVRDEDKSFVHELVDSADKAIANVDKGEVVKFINRYTRDIFDSNIEIRDLEFATLDVIAAFHSGVDETVFDFLCTEHPYLLVERFDDFEKIFKKYPDLFPLLFRIEKPEDLYSMHLDTVLAIWAQLLDREKSELKDFVNESIVVFLKNIEELVENAELEHSLLVERIARKFLSFLQRIKNPKANTFVECVNRAEKLSQEYAAAELSRESERVRSFKFEVPVGEMIDKRLNTSKWGVRLLSLTHKTQAEGEEVTWISYLERSPEEGRLVDLFGTVVPTNEFFTMSHQRNLSLISQTLTVLTLGVLFNQETRDDYLILMKHVFNFLSEQMGNSIEELEQDFEMFAQTICLVVQNVDSDDNVTRPLCYSASMYCVALLEKLLKTFYVYLVKDEKYVPVSKVTLGQLLSVAKNPELTSVFGENHVKNLSFFLLRIPETDIGENIRNSLAHLYGVSPKNFTPQLVAKALWLFTDVLNTILWYFVERVLKNSPEDN